ncbi:MAG: restriction endonuclease subunit S [Desulfosarcina sp.]|nr:restriction endonuclease subunit S [Desulfosarcina sp.]MBC2742851.1 restriction endonuclease subunit S [Desulfosarcina sp.]MBC2765761.1 restriction endonuclease subunit S [Desulfosarcina sp.]
MSSTAEKQLRHIFTVSSGATPKSGMAEYWDGDIHWATPQDLSTIEGNWLKDTRRKITQAGYESCGAQIAPTGAILLTKRAPIGELAVLAREACSNQGCFLLTPRGETDTRFFYYWLYTKKEYLQILGRGSTFMELSTDELKALRVPHPSMTHQRAIADYLDRETARIDTLVAAKERVLKLLDEKRKALITRAVTRGIDPNVKMKNSGIPWIGEIPAHWEIERTHWLFNERDERSETGQEELLTVSHITGVTPRTEKDVNMFEAETTEGYKICFADDLAINTLWAWMGAMGVSPVKGIVSPAYHVYQPGPRLDPDYVDALVRIPVFAQEVTRYSKGVWSSRLRLYPEGFFEVFFPVPPKAEQSAIVEHIATETKKLDALHSSTERTIALLKERRSALIVAAVTGNIQVEDAA